MALRRKLFSYQELVYVHRRVDSDLPAKVVFKLVLAAAGRGRVAEELGEALRGRELRFFDVDERANDGELLSLSLSLSFSPRRKTPSSRESLWRRDTRRTLMPMVGAKVGLERKKKEKGKESFV